MFRGFASALILSVLLGCAGAPLVPPVEPQDLLRDDAFAKPAQVIDASEVFAIDDAMRDYLRRAWPLMRKEGRPKGLVDALYTRGEDPRAWTIDFLPQGELRGLRTERLKEATVVSMFMNNRAAEALARDAFDEAYWWAREGLIADPSFVGVLNTLGVVYQRSGRLADAERVYNALLQRHPQQTQALHNLVQLLEQQGRHADARPIAARLAALEPEPPYHWFVQGQLALRRGDARTARDFFAREVARADYSSEFHYWLGLAQYQLGETDAAQRSLEKAESLSTSRGERDLYAAKLAWLNQRRH